MFDTKLLSTFHAVAQDCSFTRAASHLNLTQSAVSAQIRRLEDQAGVPLLLRTTRQVELTPAGEILLGYARAILHLNEDAEQQIRGGNPNIDIRIGATDDVMSSWLPLVLRDFRRAHPRIRFDTRVNNAGLLLANMEQGELDLVLGCRCSGDSSGQVLWREPLVWASASGRVPDISSPLPLALFPDPCPYRDAALAELAAAGRNWRVAALSGSIGSLRNIVRSGLAISPLNIGALTDDLIALQAGDSLPPLPNVEFVLYIRPQSSSPEIAALERMIRLYCARTHPAMLQTNTSELSPHI